MSAYRENASESIDDMRSKIEKQAKEIDRLKNKGATLRSIGSALKRKKINILIAIGFLGVAMSATLLIMSVVAESRLITKRNAEIEEKVFDSAKKWIRSYNNNQGAPWCYIKTALKDNDGRLTESTLVDCKIKHPIGDDILIQCATSGCYTTKVRCTSE